MSVEIVAHRGSSFLAPENTLPSFRLGWEETTTCELDVQATRDGRLIVIHDFTTGRTTNTDLPVAEQTLGALQQLDAGLWKGPAWRGEKLPTLEAVLRELPDGKRLLIEIKARPDAIAELARVLRASGKERQVFLQSFNLPSCIEARQQLPALPMSFLFVHDNRPDRGQWACTIDEAIAHAQAAGLAGINPSETPLLTSADVKKIHAAGLKIYVWTVDDPATARRLIDWGVDGLMTNRPAWLKAQLAREPSSP